MENGKGLKLVVEGRVQGVGFRAWSRSLAREMGVRGWVANRADGRVELHVAADEETLSRFRESLEEGPRAARVLAVRTEGGAEGLPAAGFEIRRL